jgi:hypothetical protein
MLLGFKRRFAPFVEEGSKTHTIRAIRKIVPKVGEMCHCYVDPRQKSMRLLGRFECVLVQDFVMERISTDPTVEGIAVSIDGERLSPDEREAFFHRDGFREPGRSATQQAYDFWANLERPLPWHGHLIHWKWEAPA